MVVTLVRAHHVPDRSRSPRRDPSRPPGGRLVRRARIVFLALATMTAGLVGVVPSAAAALPAASAMASPGGLSAAAAPSVVSAATRADLCAQVAFNAGFRGSALLTSVEVGLAESACVPSATGYNRSSTGTVLSVDRGIWQINSYWHPEVSAACAYNAQCNAGAAFRISAHGTNWRPWASYDAGIYLRYAVAARAAIGRLGTAGIAAVRGFTALVATDFTGDGQADILARDGAGLLWLYPHTTAGFTARRQIGFGWAGYTALLAADFTGDRSPDVVARDAAGRLWLYPHSPAGWGPRRQIGFGWAGFTTLLAADFSGDGQADILARDRSGGMWLYPHTAAGWGPRRLIGSGWQSLGGLVAADFTGDGQADVVARDAAGRLWLFGHSRLGWRRAVQIGFGWAGYTALLAMDFTGDRNADVVARDGRGGLWLFPHTPAGWGLRRQIGSGW